MTGWDKTRIRMAEVRQCEFCLMVNLIFHGCWVQSLWLELMGNLNKINSSWNPLVPQDGICHGNVTNEKPSWFSAAVEIRLPMLAASWPTHLTFCLTGMTLISHRPCVVLHRAQDSWSTTSIGSMVGPSAEGGHIPCHRPPRNAPFS